ncbi:MAG TPA: CPBP family intramembrane glutamic endopeptidase [Ktedonobacteraceae bacterium]|nr:CPBP family intramembrane glutamic endopeptidase [Ktedonobacteraceae bacterium]
MSLRKERAENTTAQRWLQIRQEYRAVFVATLRSSAAWFFCAVLLIAIGLLLLRGREDLIAGNLPFLVLVLIFALLTIPLTSHVRQLAPIETHCSRSQLWWQVALLLIIILFVTYRAAVFSQPGTFHIPFLYALVYWTINFLGPGNLFANWIAVPVLYFVLPVIVLLLLGARWSETGLGRGYHGWRVALLWSLLPLVGLGLFLILGIASLRIILIRAANNFFQNGFFEEFLFRGALMTRLSYLLSSDWGLVLSTLIFGLFHTGTQTQSLGGDWLAGAASAIVSQAVLGLGFAIIFARTRNLLASSVFHVILDTFGSFT